MVAVLVQKRHKQHVDESNVHPNPAYGGKLNFVFNIWLNALILHCKYNIIIVSSRGTVQSDYDTVDGISLNPAYGGKPSNSICTIINISL